jgi:hypothetical protein
MHSRSNFRFKANKDNQPDRQTVRYTLHQYKDDNKPKNEKINLSFSIKRLTCFEWSTAVQISFGQTQLLLLIGLYCMLLLSCHVLPIYKSCTQIHSTDESHEVWSILGGGCLGCGTLRYGSWKPPSVQKIITIYRLYHGTLPWTILRAGQHSQYSDPLQAAWSRDWICWGRNLLHLSRPAQTASVV